MLFLLAVIMTACLAEGASPTNRFCSHLLPPLKDFNATAFASTWIVDSSTWYLYNRFTCNAWNFTFPDRYAWALNFLWRFDDEQTYCMEGTERVFTGAAAYKGRYAYVRNTTCTNFGGIKAINHDLYKIQQWIIAGDSEFRQWALLYVCLPFSGAPYEIAMLLRRSKKTRLPSAIVEKVNKILTDNHFYYSHVSPAGDSTC